MILSMSEGYVKSQRDVNVNEYVSLMSPEDAYRHIPSKCSDHVLNSRKVIQNIMDGLDNRKIVIIGPCSIHDPEAAIDYARRLRILSQQYSNKLFIIMRTYFEKPRTITGWKGLLYDPKMDGTNDINLGITIVRQLLSDINEIGVPCACEFLDPNMPQYYADFISWGAIGARTTESQIHRQMASGLSCPIGFKNSTSGSVKYPIYSMKSCSVSHTFPGIDTKGKACVVNTRGNKYCHIVLRGSDKGPNYHTVKDVVEELEINKLPKNRVMIDCSHGNSNKCHITQMKVWSDINQNYLSNNGLLGIMVESNILDGSCDISECNNHSNHGRSVTDKCIGWEETRDLLEQTHNAL
jgi:3-deoxy-7-phosphoheptulonate synthase